MSNIRNNNLKKLSVLGLFIALGYICLFVFRFRVQFLTLDFKDVFITLAGFIYGPVAAVTVAFIEALLELITVSSTGFWGAIMNFAGSAAFAVTASLIYKYNKSFKGAIAALVSAVFSTTAVMMLANLIITPIYTHTDIKTVANMILPLLLPFNLIKSVLNAVFTFVLYKPVTQALRSMNILPKSENVFALNKRTVCGIITAFVILIISVAVMIVLLGGDFEFVKHS